jgi:hypothetical protein
VGIGRDGAGTLSRLCHSAHAIATDYTKRAAEDHGSWIRIAHPQTPVRHGSSDPEDSVISGMPTRSSAEGSTRAAGR